MRGLPVVTTAAAGACSATNHAKGIGIHAARRAHSQNSDFVHHRYYSEKGLLYSHLNFAEERPHTEADSRRRSEQSRNSKHDVQNLKTAP
jgi:hypothetical protein